MVQGFRPLVREDPTCYGATEPVCHNPCGPWALGPTLPNTRSDGNEKPPAPRHKETPAAATGESPRAAVKTQSSQR